MESKFVIGQILKPQGIKGELKIMPLTDDPERFKKLKKVIIDDTTYAVTGAKIAQNGVFLSLSNVSDRNTAELFRGKFLHVLREDTPAPEKGRYFIVDLIGCDLLVEDEKLAKITDVTKGRTDVITAVTPLGKTLRFPFLNDAVTKVDVEGGIFRVNKKRFEEIVVYED